MTRLFALALSLFIAGCSVAPVKAPEPEGLGTLEQHAAAIGQLERWGLAGRAAVNTPTDSGTVSVDWDQRGENYDLQLRAPWGAGTVRLQGGPEQVRLRTSNGVEDSAAEPGELLRRHTGLDLPVQALRYWLLGLPEPGVPAEPRVDARGLLSELRQNGWHIQYRRYADIAGLALPTTVFMRGDGLELRVVVQRWVLY